MTWKCPEHRLGEGLEGNLQCPHCNRTKVKSKTEIECISCEHGYICRGPTYMDQCTVIGKAILNDVEYSESGYPRGRPEWCPLKEK